MEQDDMLLNSRTKGIKVDNNEDENMTASLETPMAKVAIDLSDEEKILEIEKSFKHIMEVLGLDLTDDSLSGTPHRVAKMYVKETFSGLNQNFPDIKLFENKYKYQEMLVVKNIVLYSNCEHHFVPIIGKAHVAYISSKKIIGLSKINRVVEYYAKRPQIQERLTKQIANALRKILETEDIAVMIDAVHLCVSSRGIKDTASSTVTTAFFGAFTDEHTQNKFLRSFDQYVQ